MKTDREFAPSVAPFVNVMALGFHDAQGENGGWLKDTSVDMKSYENELSGLTRRDVLMHHSQRILKGYVMVRSILQSYLKLDTT